MKQELIGEIHSVIRMYHVYKNSKTKEGALRHLELLREMSYIFEEKWNSFYNINYKISEWIIMLGRDELNERNIYQRTSR